MPCADAGQCGLMADTAIADLLRDEGFKSTLSVATARAVLEAAGLTRPGKTRRSSPSKSASDIASGRVARREWTGSL